MRVTWCWVVCDWVLWRALDAGCDGDVLVVLGCWSCGVGDVWLVGGVGMVGCCCV